MIKNKIENIQDVLNYEKIIVANDKISINETIRIANPSMFHYVFFNSTSGILLGLIISSYIIVEAFFKEGFNSGMQTVGIWGLFCICILAAHFLFKPLKDFFYYKNVEQNLNIDSEKIVFNGECIRFADIINIDFIFQDKKAYLCGLISSIENPKIILTKKNGKDTLEFDDSKLIKYGVAIIYGVIKNNHKCSTKEFEETFIQWWNSIDRSFIIVD